MVLLTLVAFAVSTSAVPPLVTTLAREVGATDQAFGHVFMLQFLFFTLASLVGGWATIRFGIRPRTLVVLGLAGVSAALAAGAFLSSLAWITLWIVPLGFAGGLIETFASVMVSEFERPRSSKLMNLSQAFFCLGAILAPQVVALSLRHGWSWRWAFVMFGGFVFAIGALFVANTRGGLPVPHMNAAPVAAAGRTDDRPFTDALFYLMAGVLFLYVVAEGSTACWIAVYFEKQLGASPGAAASRVSLFWTGLIVGRLLMLAVPHRWALWPALFVSAIAMTGANVLLALPWSVPVATTLLLLTGLACGPIWPVIVATSRALRHSARFTAGVIAAGALGAALGPFASSQVMSRWGLARLFPFHAAVCGLMLAVIGLAARRAHAQL